MNNTANNIDTTETVIIIGDKVRSFDSMDTDRHFDEGPRANFVEGLVLGFKNIEGCARYEIKPTRRVIQGQEVGVLGEANVYPPLNGTPTWLGDVCNGVKKI